MLERLRLTGKISVLKYQLQLIKEKHIAQSISSYFATVIYKFCSMLSLLVILYSNSESNTMFLQDLSVADLTLFIIHMDIHQ